MKHVDRGCARGSFPRVQGVHDATVLLVDRHHESPADSHAVAAEQPIAEQRGYGGINGTAVST